VLYLTQKPGVLWWRIEVSKTHLKQNDEALTRDWARIHLYGWEKLWKEEDSVNSNSGLQ
jgi:hypothetical protein